MHGDAPRETCAETVGRALKLVVERAWPHRVVGVHIFGPDACELIHFGTTLVQALHTTHLLARVRARAPRAPRSQGRKTVSDVLRLCFAAVTYHELFKLAALAALKTLEKDTWRELWRELDEINGVQYDVRPADLAARLKACARP